MKASPYEFTIATRAKWVMVIADKDVTIGAGKLERVKVKEINVQRDMLTMPCACGKRPDNKYGLCARAGIWRSQKRRFSVCVEPVSDNVYARGY